MFIIPNDIIARSSPIMDIGIQLKSYFGSTIKNITNDSLFFPKTDDLHSSGGYMFLVNEDKSKLEDDLNFLRKIEKGAFSLVFSEDSCDFVLKDDEVYSNEIRHLIENSQDYGTGLVVTDQFLEDMDILQLSHDKIDELKGKFDFIIVNLNKSIVDKNEAEKVKMILNIFSKVRTGGLIFIPKNTYSLMANGRRGMEALLEVLEYTIEFPPYNIKEVIIATKDK